jgi:DNA-binding MarR family transcriptional regulator
VSGVLAENRATEEAMRSTQLQTLRAVAAGSDRTSFVAGRLGIPLSSAAGRLRTLVKMGMLECHKPVGQHANEYSLTDRARALLETRARLDGEAP